LGLVVVRANIYEWVLIYVTDISWGVYISRLTQDHTILTTRTASMTAATSVVNMLHVL